MPFLMKKPENFRIAFLARSYSRSCLRSAYNKTFAQSRVGLLFKHRVRDDSDSDPTRIIMRFSKQHNEIKEKVRKHWTILSDDPKVNTFVSINPLITFKRATSLKDKLAQSKFKNESKWQQHCLAFD